MDLLDAAELALKGGEWMACHICNGAGKDKVGDVLEDCLWCGGTGGEPSPRFKLALVILRVPAPRPTSKQVSRALLHRDFRMGPYKVGPDHERAGRR